MVLMSSWSSCRTSHRERDAWRCCGDIAGRCNLGSVRTDHCVAPSPSSPLPSPPRPRIALSDDDKIRDNDDRWLHKYKVLRESAKELVEKAIQQTVDFEAQAGGAESHLREYGVREGKPGAVPLAFAAPSRPCARPAWAHTPAIIMMQSLITSNRRVPRSPSAP